jgi:hypothetical protein
MNNKLQIIGLVSRAIISYFMKNQIKKFIAWINYINFFLNWYGKGFGETHLP